MINIEWIDRLNELFIVTHPVDENGDIFEQYDRKMDESEDESGGWDGYYDTIDEPPYSNIEFMDPIPEEGEMIVIPDQISDDMSIVQRVAYIMTSKPCSCFSNGR